MKRSIYICRKVLNSNEIREWAKAQGFISCLQDSDLHVTVAFDYKKHDWSKIPLSQLDRVEVAGATSVAEFRRGAIVLTLDCDTLQGRWQQLCDWGLRWKFKDYRPHITITYQLPEGMDPAAVKPFSGKVILGPEVLVEVLPVQHPVEHPLI